MVLARWSAMILELPTRHGLRRGIDRLSRKFF